jgi:VanZ family protein
VSSKRRRPTIKPSLRSLANRWWPVAVWLVVLRIESSDFASSANTFGLLYRIATAIFGPINPSILMMLNGVMRKSGHFVGYGVLSLLVFRALKYTQYDRLRLVLQRRWGLFFRDLWRFEWAEIAVLFTLVAASFDELHQVFIPSRTGRWQDVALDTAGAIAMQLLLYARASHMMKLQRKPAGERVNAPRPH